MFDLTVADIAEKARELNFVRDTLEKVLRLVDVFGLYEQKFFNEREPGVERRRIALSESSSYNAHIIACH
ncbi:MAG: hypothetical protein WCY53_05230 [Sphaerochaetaceae bacterium]